MEDFKKHIVPRLWLIYWLMFLVGVVIIGQVAYIQIVKGEAYRKLATEATLRFGEIEASRGNILAHDGKLLATTVPIFDIRMDVGSPNISNELFNRNADSLAIGLALIFPQNNREHYRKMLLDARRKKNRYLLIKRDVDYATLKKIKKLPILRQGTHRGGLIVQQKNIRKMPYGILAQRTIGYENVEEKLFVGLEGAYNEHLRGQNGQMWMQRISGGEWIPVLNSERIEPRNGKDIVTTIDVLLQDVAENALLRQLREQDAFQGCVVLMEVATGDIRAIANLRKNKLGMYDEIYNYALGESIEPGSTFKLASLLAAIEYGNLELTDSVPYQGQVKWSNLTMRDDHPLNKKYITIEQSFTHSSNVGVSKIVEMTFRKKPQRFGEMLSDMGLGKPIGTDIPGEGQPYFRSTAEKKWPLTTLPYMSIGYELKITPLQTLTFYNAIANNGTMVKPRFVSEIQNAGQTIRTLKPEIIKKSVCSQKTISKARRMMETVVEKGTAREAFKNTPYKVAGKTGTAQIVTGGKYNKENYNASFVGYFPADNPLYSIIVVINNPAKGKIYGGAVAAPVFREIADRVYATRIGPSEEKKPSAQAISYSTDSLSGQASMPVKGWKPDMLEVGNLLGLQVDTNNSRGMWCIGKQIPGRLKLSPVMLSVNNVPDVTGMTARDAVYLLESVGLTVVVQGKGKVKSQSLTAGTEARKGSTVYLTLSTSQI
jgi:cell division protein FtsI (penicillin-binding protein 3)